MVRVVAVVVVVTVAVLVARAVAVVRLVVRDWFSSCVVQLCTGLSQKKYFKCRTVQYDTIST